MGTKQINSLVPDLISENILHFEKRENGLYKKIEKIIVKDRRTGKRTVKDEIESDEYYKLVSCDDYDYEIIIQDHEGNDLSTRFKSVEIQ
ncbi:hypothetical protein CMI47_19125 [Candidatus Pacearchaeota archaeon]|nr:hypothetical protein [Candidatus Pacearchaeota archaeon]|tara:strand:+ start:3008 stop:3277 length:270 start_codon:yes stop_codon:yes gene_type:complete